MAYQNRKWNSKCTLFTGKKGFNCIWDGAFENLFALHFHIVQIKIICIYKTKLCIFGSCYYINKYRINKKAYTRILPRIPVSNVERQQEQGSRAKQSQVAHTSEWSHGIICSLYNPFICFPGGRACSWHFVHHTFVWSISLTYWR